MIWRFMSAIMAVALFIVLVLLVPLSGYLAQNEQDRLTTALERDAFVLAGRSAEALEQTGETAGAAEAVITELARAYSDAAGARVVVVDRDGIAVVTSDEDAAGIGDSFLSRPEIATALSGGIANGTRYSQTLGLELLYVAVPVLAGEHIAGAVRLTYPASVVADAANAKVGALLVVALVTVLLAGGVGFVLARGVTGHLRRLTELTERFAEGGLAERAETGTGAPELRSLARSFNTMADRVTDALEQQRRFAADASHQLRTPLTALRLRLERARQLADEDPAQAVERIAAAELEVQRLDGIVEGLLALSRAESAGLRLEPVDLAELARARVEHWLPLAREHGVEVVYAGTERSTVLASSTVVEQIVDNYVDNALEASPSGGLIEVRVELRAHGAELHVLDEGPGLPSDHLERAFERFWRGGASAAGNGLGLAIVAQLARASGVEVHLANRPDGGLDASAGFTDSWLHEHRPSGGGHADRVGGEG